MEQALALEQEELEQPSHGILTDAIGLIMLAIALLVDGSELVLTVLQAIVGAVPYVGVVMAFMLEALSVIIDFTALIIIGIWMLVRSGKITAPKSTAARVTKIAKWGKRLKWLRPLMIGVEMIPIVGSAPCWIIAVYLELKYG